MIILTIRNKFWILLIAFLLGVLCGQCKADDIDINQIIKIESNGDPNAYNKKSGCIGLMQINPNGALLDWNNEIGIFGTHYKNADTAKTMMELEIAYDNYYTIGDLYNPTINVKIGSWYINTRIPQMLKAYGIEDTVENRIIAYSWGIGNLRKYLKGKKKLPKETRGYLRKYKE